MPVARIDVAKSAYLIVYPVAHDALFTLGLGGADQRLLALLLPLAGASDLLRIRVRCRLLAARLSATGTGGAQVAAPHQGRSNLLAYGSVHHSAISGQQSPNCEHWPSHQQPVGLC